MTLEVCPTLFGQRVFFFLNVVHSKQLQTLMARIRGPVRLVIVVVSVSLQRVLYFSLAAGQAAAALLAILLPDF